MRASFRVILILAVTLLLISGCSGREAPSAPNMAGNPGIGQEIADNNRDVSGSQDNHICLLYNQIQFDLSDPANPKYEVIPMRGELVHLNILKILEAGICTNCFQIVGLTLISPGTYDIDIQITHPIADLQYSIFDVRGIMMFHGTHSFPASGSIMSDTNLGDGALLNPDGYTSLYNGTTQGLAGPLFTYYAGKLSTPVIPNSDINGYLRHNSETTRNAFFAGESVTRTYTLKFPTSGPFELGYAVDCNWDIPTTTPVIDPLTQLPPEANCPEPYRVEASSSSINPYSNATVTIDVYDWQGKTSHADPVLECPDLFDGALTGVFIADGSNYTRYSTMVSNVKSAPDGIYKCLISVLDNANDPVNTPWLDLTAYQVVDITVSHDFNLTEVTPPGLNQCTEDYEVSGNYLFIAAYFNGIQVYDITNPDNPVWVRQIPIPGFSEVFDMTISGGYLYAATYYQNVMVIDIDPIDQASVVGSLDTSPVGIAIACNGTTVYTAGPTYPDGEFSIVDATDPTAPTETISLPLVGYPVAVEYSIGYAYVVTDSNFYIIDVDPPASASIVTTIATGGNGQNVAIDGGYAYLANNIGLQIVDIDPPVSASIINTVTLGDSCYAVDVKDGYAFAADMSSGIEIVDVDPPGAASVVNSVLYPGFMSEARINGNYLIAGALGRTLMIDITNPMAASINKVIDYPGSVFEVAASGITMLLANADCGTLVVDVSNPEDPQIANSLDIMQSWAVDIDGNYGYTLGGAGLSIIDMSTPGSETVIKEVFVSNGSMEVLAASGYAYVAASSQGLVIVDVDPPATASVVATVPTTLQANGVDIYNGYAFVAEGLYPNGILGIIDIEPPGAATEVHTVDLPSEAYEVKIVGNYAYIADSYSALQVVDISDPLTASLVGSAVLTGDAAQSIDYDNGYLFVNDYSSGFEVIDISNPVLPVELTHLQTPGFNLDVDVQGNYAYLASYYGGVRIVRLY
ncbi:MAG: hypothetical protein NTY09_11100 [bacterium]|nr:hypothetical protein [bacterium]